jgi:hypothetical protein
MSGAEGLDDQATQNGDHVPTVDEIYDQFEAEQGLAIVMADEVRDWIEDCARAVRAAGRRGLDGIRQGSLDSIDGHERFGFAGRYAGKAAVTPQLLEREWGTSDPTSITEAA